jgi:hypothetical protein
MAFDSQDSSSSTADNDRSNRWAFYFFVGALGFSLLAALWMLVQTAFL